MEKTKPDGIKKKKSKIVLTMETAVMGGSVSIFCDEKLLDFYIGDKTVSSAEDLLPKISDLLKENEISKSDIDSIVISNGPGSFTGIRIGIATALALQKSLGCKCYGFDLLKIMSEKGSHQAKTDRIISAVSQGRNKICWFDLDADNKKSSISENKYFISDLDFLVNHLEKNLKNYKTIAAIADFNIYATLTDQIKVEFRDKLRLINAGENLSAILGFAVWNTNSKFEKPKPLYLSETSLIS